MRVPLPSAKDAAHAPGEPVKIVHLTDLHVQCPPRLTELWGKRLIGSTNLYLLGRKSHFSGEVAAAAIATTLDEAPDAVVITGDLTAQGLDAEFSASRQLLDPLLARFPTVLLAGNHDTYVREAAPAARMREVFHPWMGAQSPHLRSFDGVHVLTVETCRAHPLSSGFTEPSQLVAASALLREAGPGFVFLALHYPLRDRRGGPYGPWTRSLSNARAVEAWITSEPRIGAILHGHEHHGFTTLLDCGEGRQVPIYDPGASGYAPDPVRDRTAHLNIYEVDARGIHGLRRLRFADGAFTPEPGGPYATGR